MSLEAPTGAKGTDAVAPEQDWIASSLAPPLTVVIPRHRVSPSANPVRRGLSFPSQASLEYWVARSSRAMTTGAWRVRIHDKPSRSRGAMRPSFCKNCSPSKIEGAGNAGRLMRPRPRVRNKIKHTSVVTTVTPVSPGIPRAMVLTAYFVLSPATNSSCHRHPRIEGLYKARSGRLASTDLTPATGARTTRLRRPH